MKINGIEGLTNADLQRELDHGGKFVVYTYCISILVMTFKRSSEVYFIRAGHGRLVKGLPFLALSLVLGWWGIPWGPIYTIGCIATNLGGGKDVTRELLAAMQAG